MADIASQNILAKQVSAIGVDSNANNLILLGLEARVVDLQSQVKSLQELKRGQDVKIKTLESSSEDLQMVIETHAGIIADHTESLSNILIGETVAGSEHRDLSVVVEDIQGRVQAVEFNQVDQEPVGDSGALAEEVAGIKDRLEELPTVGEINLTKARYESQLEAMRQMVTQIKLLKGENVKLTGSVRNLEQKLLTTEETKSFNQQIGLGAGGGIPDLDDPPVEDRLRKKAKMEASSPSKNLNPRGKFPTQQFQHQRHQGNFPNQNQNGFPNQSQPSQPSPALSRNAKFAAFKRSIVAILTTQAPDLPGFEMDRVASAISEFPKNGPEVSFSGINDYLLANIKEDLKQESHLVAAVIWGAYHKNFPKDPKDEKHVRGNGNRGGRGGHRGRGH
jgi:hypothetical protein